MLRIAILFTFWPLFLICAKSSAVSIEPGPLAASKLEALDRVLKARNINDPRIDWEFKDLDPESKRLFERRYFELPQEEKLQRGLIVKAIAENLSQKQDILFLRKVLKEKRNPESTQSWVQNYPQTIAGHALRKFYKKPRKS